MTTMTEQEAIRVLRAALEGMRASFGNAAWLYNAPQSHKDAYNACQKALAATATIQPVAAPEPVGYVSPDALKHLMGCLRVGLDCNITLYSSQHDERTTPLYTAAPAQAATDAARDALVRWWEEKRPFGWPESEHIEVPEINCTGAEKPLALLAAALRTTGTDSEKGGVA